MFPDVLGNHRLSDYTAAAPLLVHTADTDKTRQSRLVRVGRVDYRKVY